VPFNENSHTLSPCGVPANTLPAEYTATYSSPSYSNTAAGAFTPAPVWNSQSRFPVALLSAVSLPSFRPTKTSPPAVVTEPL